MSTNIYLIEAFLPAWTHGATVARSTPDRKVICSNQVGFIHVSRILLPGQKVFGYAWFDQAGMCFCDFCNVFGRSIEVSPNFGGFAIKDQNRQNNSRFCKSLLPSRRLHDASPLIV